ncbi:autotransporter outer membrane beta-barrel domain-containing protein [Salmonella enterica]|uniref:Autotransporter n=3 Tax=Salmonella enterica TaxID=28901 RepID=A0A2X4TJB7_SALER|nr:autotransporter outer membrane beta-barrel domain-containing protein [Salmonella enterica]EBP3476578.1 autotransporter outer membrane beta-barrel domain-containing protein [Salmonella enterica subsp. enterica]ECG8551508.1 autotransporter outer membrane beta-barrel domain-containing protein [Salmonella enterica subsp. arizonae]EDW1854437.1 autotransporter outer membrane beta-barrel domain-containing protein [Salmonella enterica subsp. diarizonae]HAE8120692.1 autotransporter outer membrane bet
MPTPAAAAQVSGAGMQAGVSFQLYNVEVKPCVELAYVWQFGTETNSHTDDYRFTCQNFNSVNAGPGMEVRFAVKRRAQIPISIRNLVTMLTTN